MDPVYAGVIAGLTLLFTGVVCGIECNVKDTEYSAV